jgi:hypothetical protein
MDEVEEDIRATDAGHSEEENDQRRSQHLDARADLRS